MKKEIFIDNLRLSNLLKLLFIGKNNTIFVLDDLSKKNRLAYFLLLSLNYKVEELDFYCGNIVHFSGINLHTYSRKISAKLSFEISQQLCSEGLLKKINEEFGRRTIELFIAKKLLHYLEFFILKVFVVQHFSKQKTPLVLLPTPLLFDKKILQKEFPEIDLRFYYFPFINTRIDTEKEFNYQNYLYINILNFFIRNLYSKIKSFFKNKNYFIHKFSSKSVICPLEQDLVKRKGLKNQFFWSSDKLNNKIKYFVIGEGLRKIKSEENQKSLLIFSPTEMFFLRKRFKEENLIKKIRKVRKLILRDSLNKKNYQKQVYFEIYKLLFLSELISSVAILTKSNKFLFYKTDLASTDAVQLISKDLNIETVGFQYSNMGYMTPMMVTTADKFLLFSKNYENIYRYKGVGPGEFIENGYPMNFKDKEMIKLSNVIKRRLKKENVSFIISYFNESEQLGKWGHYSSEYNKEILMFFSKMIIENPEIAVILKPQRSLDLLNKFFDNNLILKALNTGRLFEAILPSTENYSHNLNLIYPAMTASVSNLSISHVVGGTAFLESALTGTNSILLDLKNDKKNVFWEKYLIGKNYIFDNLKNLEQEILKIKDLADEKKRNIESSSLKKLDPFQDSKGHERIERLLKEKNLDKYISQN